ncbi:zinc-binding alcohol dehydrogenase [bacterium]|nr:zinc-binding alcohol dehydrogenase [bacterium]
MVEPGAGQVLVQAEMSAISAGSELLVYRGQMTQEMGSQADSIFGFPTKFGYAMVGRVLETGAGVSSTWKGKRVFACHPHESHFLANPRDLTLLPEGVEPESGVFLPLLESAVNLLQDGRPMIGERVAIFGQGALGLLTLALLRHFPLGELVTCDPIEARRHISREWGAQHSLDPADAEELRNCDLTYELSGQPGTLTQAIQATGFSGRVVIGSWYGSKRAEVELGGSFHRSRIHILSSQVSTIDPPLSGAWTRERRMLVATSLLDSVRPQRLISHRFPASAAAEAYDLLDREPADVLQVVLTYE